MATPECHDSFLRPQSEGEHSRVGTMQTDARSRGFRAALTDDYIERADEAA